MSHHDPAPTRGRLKVFLGYASGVGKSFRMLDEGRRRRERGQDVVAGALQPRIPEPVLPLLSSLESVPTVEIDGIPAMNVPAILQRHPQVCLVDGLAYDNPPGSRNAYRWEDVEELLAAGVSVVGSVNVQHVDDQREAVERITGKKVTQTIPRAFLNTADEIEIVDSPPSDASPLLSALREKALLLSADVIDAGLQRYLHDHGIEAAWRTHEHFLIYLTPGANLPRMLASACRNAARFHCDVMATVVKQDWVSNDQREALEDVLDKARASGARVDVLEGEDSVETIVQYARAHGVTQIFVGQTRILSWRARWFGSAVNRLIRAAREIDVRVFPAALGE